MISDLELEADDDQMMIWNMEMDNNLQWNRRKLAYLTKLFAMRDHQIYLEVNKGLEGHMERGIQRPLGRHKRMCL